MPRLNESMQRFIVQALACYDSPSQVAETVKEEFGALLPRQQIAKYDPTKATGAQLSKKWRDLFEDTRARFRAEVSEIPIANQAFRLRTLQVALRRAESRGNIVLAAQLLEQAAREVGGAFTNSKKQELGGDNGKPISVMPNTIELVVVRREAA